MTREELHELVWSQPMTAVAQSMGISDVALAKRCRNANVPVPPRGWWAKKAAGAPVKVAPLPRCAFVMGNYFPAIERQAGGKVSGAGTEDVGNDTPPPPVFRSLEAVHQEIRAAVKPIKVPTTLNSPHPIVARLLKQDAERQSRTTPGGYLSSFYGPKFATPIQQRRLRILSCVLAELERLGCKASGTTHAGEKFNVNVGGRWTCILFSIEGGTFGDPFHRGWVRTSRPSNEQLRFDITDFHQDNSQPKRTWRDGEQKLEHQATDIACGVLLCTEEEARKAALWRHKFDLEEKARKAEEARLAEEKRPADRIARKQMAEEARIKRLLDGADSLERAARIRRYVASVQTESAASAEAISPEALNAWTEWALAQADRIDPVLSRQFLTDLETSEEGDEQYRLTPPSATLLRRRRMSS